MNHHLPDLLVYYGPFCSLNIIRSTLDCGSLSHAEPLSSQVSFASISSLLLRELTK